MTFDLIIIRDDESEESTDNGVLLSLISLRWCDTVQKLNTTESAFLQVRM